MGIDTLQMHTHKRHCENTNNISCPERRTRSHPKKNTTAACVPHTCACAHAPGAIILQETHTTHTIATKQDASPATLTSELPKHVVSAPQTLIPIPCYSKHKHHITTDPRTSGLPRRVFVCPSNSGEGTLTEMTPDSPSLTWSPDRAGSVSLTN